MKSALIIVDVLNTYEHEDADGLLESVGDTLPAIEALVARARRADVPIVYVNDNHGDFSACRPELVRRALDGRAPHLVEPIAPPDDVAFVVKARHSIFYETQLEYLLRREKIERIVLAGQVTEQCILYSALDGYVRCFAVGVPRDAVAAIDTDLAAAALRMMELKMSADLGDSRECDLQTA